MESLDMPHFIIEPPFPQELLRKFDPHASFRVGSSHKCSVSSIVGRPQRYSTRFPMQQLMKNFMLEGLPACATISRFYLRIERVKYASAPSLRVAQAAIRIFWSPTLLPSLRNKIFILFSRSYILVHRTPSLFITTFEILLTIPHCSIQLPSCSRGGRTTWFAATS